MAKINILFNGSTYSIDEASLSTASAALKSHLSTVMNGTGASIALDGTSYNVDSTKLTAATNAFVSYLGTIAGSGSKVVVNGTEYSIDSAKIATAISEMASVLGGLQSEGGSSDLGEVILAEAVVNGFFANNGIYMQTCVNLKLDAGCTYRVVWDDNEYIATSCTIDGDDAIFIGNLGLLGVGENTGEPFVMMSMEDVNPDTGENQGWYTVIMTTDTSDSHTVGINKLSTGSQDLLQVILAERQYSFIADDEAGILTTATDGNFVNFSLTIGNTYKVVLDGEEYTCIANVYNNHIYMGNLSISVDDASNTGEPFLVYCDDIGNPAIFIKDSNSVHTVGIYKVSGIDAVLAELEYFFYDTGNGLYATNIEIDSHFVDFSLASGNTYKVVWDDEEYIRVAGDVTGYNYIGNLAIMGMGENTGEPFVIGVDPSVNHAIIYTLEAGNNSMHTVGIYKQ